MNIAQVLIAAMIAALGLTAAGHLPSGTAPSRRSQQWQSLESNLEVPPAVSRIIARACRDCHSNETVWPWYSRLAPLSWLVELDVRKGRAAMNFSTWSSGPGRKPSTAASTLAAACADIRSDRMPPVPYRVMHSDSRLSEHDKEVFCEWANRLSSDLLSRSGGGEQ